MGGWGGAGQVPPTQVRSEDRGWGGGRTGTSQPPSRSDPRMGGWGEYSLLEQHSVYLLRSGQYTSCIHAGGLSCIKNMFLHWELTSTTGKILKFLKIYALELVGFNSNLFGFCSKFWVRDSSIMEWSHCKIMEWSHCKRLNCTCDCSLGGKTQNYISLWAVVEK